MKTNALSQAVKFQAVKFQAVKSQPFKTILGTIAALTVLATTGQQAQAGTLYKGWNYSIDSFHDGTEGGVIGAKSEFEFYGMAMKQTKDRVYFAINSNLSLQGHAYEGARNWKISYGDLFLDFSGKNNFNQANGNLHAIRFDAGNDTRFQRQGLTSAELARIRGLETTATTQQQQVVAAQNERAAEVKRASELDKAQTSEIDGIKKTATDRIRAQEQNITTKTTRIRQIDRSLRIERNATRRGQLIGEKTRLEGEILGHRQEITRLGTEMQETLAPLEAVRTQARQQHQQALTVIDAKLQLSRDTWKQTVRTIDQLKNINPELGLYGKVQATSVATVNSGYSSLKHHAETVANLKDSVDKNMNGFASLGDLAAENSYLQYDGAIANVMSAGSRLGGIRMISDVSRLDLDFGRFGTKGTHTFGFSVDSKLLPRGNFVASLFAECGNDGVVLKGRLAETVPEPSAMIGLTAVGLMAGREVLRRRSQKPGSV